MSRAMRRQPLVQKPPAKGPSFKPTQTRPSTKKTESAVAAEKAHRTFWERIPFFGRGLQDIINELKKVTWPTREETIRLSIAVIAVAATIGLALGGLDAFYNWLFDNTVFR
jgi:preprotein translocase subunit SecE